MSWSGFNNSRVNNATSLTNDQRQQRGQLTATENNAVGQQQDATTRPALQPTALVRDARSIDYPPASDTNHEEIASLAQHRLDARGRSVELPRGWQSGRNMFAIFLDVDGKPRLRANMRITRGASNSQQGVQWPESSVVLNMGLTMRDIITRYPLQLYGTGVRLLLAERVAWPAVRVDRTLPHAFAAQFAAQRNGNTIAQRCAREAKRMRKEQDEIDAEEAAAAAAAAATQAAQDDNVVDDTVGTGEVEEASAPFGADDLDVADGTGFTDFPEVIDPSTGRPYTQYMRDVIQRITPRSPTRK